MKKNSNLFRPASTLCITIVATLILCGFRSENKERISEVKAEPIDKATRAQDVYEPAVFIDSRQIKEEVVVEKDTNTSLNEDKIFETVEQAPQFPGGEIALLRYVADHIIYPATAMENGIQGKVIVKFVVTKTGEIGQIKVIKVAHPDLDAEAVRVIKTLPKFIPGKMNGKPVNSWYTFPMVFRLNH